MPKKLFTKFDAGNVGEVLGNGVVSQSLHLRSRDPRKFRAPMAHLCQPGRSMGIDVCPTIHIPDCRPFPADQHNTVHAGRSTQRMVDHPGITLHPLHFRCHPRVPLLNNQSPPFRTGALGSPTATGSCHGNHATCGVLPATTRSKWCSMPSDPGCNPHARRVDPGTPGSTRLTETPAGTVPAARRARRRAPVRPGN